MHNSPYTCSLCKRKFGRKWNALRHNFTYFNQGKIYDRFNTLVENLPLPQSKISSLKNNGIDGVIKTCAKESSKNRNNIIGIPFIKNALKTDITSEDDVFDDGIEKFGLVMNELDDFLSNHPKDVRDQVRSTMIVLAISSHDPIGSLKEILSFLKNKETSKEIIGCISSYCNIPESMASVALRNSILRKHKDSIWAEKANSGCLLPHNPHNPQQQQQQQQKPRSPPFFAPSINKLKPIKSKEPLNARKS